MRLVRHVLGDRGGRSNVTFDDEVVAADKPKGFDPGCDDRELRRRGGGRLSICSSSAEKRRYRQRW